MPIFFSYAEREHQKWTMVIDLWPVEGHIYNTNNTPQENTTIAKSHHLWLSHSLTDNIDWVHKQQRELHSNERNGNARFFCKDIYQQGSRTWKLIFFYWSGLVVIDDIFACTYLTLCCYNVELRPMNDAPPEPPGWTELPRQFCDLIANCM